MDPRQGSPSVGELIRKAHARVQASRLRIEATRERVRTSEELRRRLLRGPAPRGPAAGWEKPPRAGDQGPGT